MSAVVYIDFAEDGSILYIGATTDYAKRVGQHVDESPWTFDVAHTAFIHVSSKAEAHAVERMLIAAHNPPNNWLGRSIPNPRPRPTREENIAACHARRNAPDYADCVLVRRMREALNVVGERLVPDWPTERQAS